MIVPPEIHQENKRIVAACGKVKFIKKCSNCGKSLKDDNTVLSVILVNTRNREPGKPESIDSGKSATASLLTTKEMAADSKGLVHGGFAFGLADYAAMLAVNDPFVVLLASNVRFTKPVSVGDKLTANAKITDTEDNRRKVWCEVTNQNGTKVFEGEFLCMVLERHVLER